MHCGMLGLEGLVLLCAESKCSSCWEVACFLISQGMKAKLEELKGCFRSQTLVRVELKDFSVVTSRHFWVSGPLGGEWHLSFVPT